MNLASPAPKVEPAVCDPVRHEDPAVADMAIPTEAPDTVEPAKPVDPAVPYDDPMKYAPENVINPKTIAPSALSAEVLRNENTNDPTTTYFEGYVGIIPGGAPHKTFLQRLPLLSFFIGGRDFISYGEIRKYIVVKGYSCFVYIDKTDPSPLYGIALDELYPILEDPKQPDINSITVSPSLNTNLPHESMKTILLKNKKSNHSKIAYQFTFDTSNDHNLAQKFLDMFDSLNNNKYNVKLITNNEKMMERTKQKDDNVTVIGAVTVSNNPKKKDKK